TAGTWPCGGFLFSYGGEVIKDGRCVLDSDQAIAAIDMYGRLLKDAGPLGVGNYHWYEVLNDFSAGAAAIAMDSSNFATDFQNPEKKSGTRLHHLRRNANSCKPFCKSQYLDVASWHQPSL
ncbi:substrate-binding protein, partial [Vibrio nigripulchritudo ATCC 27043]|uniref:extracellular solute-binding protein n=1 Tax=Vibrio nigripulchritudo TaxID=28173 RepID=UPI00021C2E77